MPRPNCAAPCLPATGTRPCPKTIPWTAAPGAPRAWRAPGPSRIPAMPSTMRSGARKLSPPVVRAFGSGFSRGRVSTGRSSTPRTRSPPPTTGACPWARTYAPEAESPPGFFVWALRDPATVALQRLQVVKGWVEDGESFERVYDVACSDGGTVDDETHRCPDNGATVDIATCAVSPDKGASELAASVDRPRLQARSTCFLLCPRAGKPQVPVVHLGCHSSRRPPQPRHARHHPGPRLVVSHLDSPAAVTDSPGR